jgi:hypothetical protein
LYYLFLAATASLFNCIYPLIELGVPDSPSYHLQQQILVEMDFRANTLVLSLKPPNMLCSSVTTHLVLANDFRIASSSKV